MNPDPKMNLSMVIQHPPGANLRRGGGVVRRRHRFYRFKSSRLESQHHKEHGNPNPNISASVPHPC